MTRALSGCEGLGRRKSSMRFPRHYKFALYRASKIVNSSESMGRQTMGRSTGMMGTGVYFYRTKSGAETFADHLNKNYSEGHQVFEAPEPERPLQLRDSDTGSFHDFSKALIALTYERLYRMEAKERGLTQKEIDKSKAHSEDLYREAEIMAPAGLGYSRADAQNAVETTANEMHGKDWRELDNVSQPINKYLRAKGYDGVLVWPGGKFDNSQYGSVYFVEDYEKRFGKVAKN